MVKKKILVGAGFLTLAGLMGGASIASAHGLGNRPIDTQTKQDIEEAIETGDFQTWKSLLPEDNPRFGDITEEQFAKIQKLHEARKNGDKDTMQSIAKEIGLKMGQRNRMQKNMGDPEKMQAIHAAVESGNYEQWRELMGEAFSKNVPEEKAQAMFKMHQLRIQGDSEEATAFAKELGLNKGKRGGENMFFRKGNNKPQ